MMETAVAAGAPALVLRNVRREFGAHVAVDDVSLTVGQGEFLTLLGPSGCGKTTILRMVAGFETPSAGSIAIGGRPMAGVPPYRRPIGIVFQNLALFPHMTVAGNIGFGLEVARAPAATIKARVDEALALIQLEGLGSRRVHEISGGQRQRVALARALVTRPTVLLLDEPLGALDLKIRRQLQVELKRIQRQVGTTFVFVTHDQEEALTMSDRIAVMNAGRVEQLGAPSDIYDRPRTAFVARFIGDTNLLSGRIASAGAGTAAIRLDDDGATLRGRLEGQTVPGEAATVAVRPENVEIVPAMPGVEGWRGRVAEMIYAGSHVRYRVRAGSAEILVDRPAAPSRALGLAVGDEVLLSFDPSDGIVQVGAAQARTERDFEHA